MTGIRQTDASKTYLSAKKTDNHTFYTTGIAGREQQKKDRMKTKAMIAAAMAGLFVSAAAQDVMAQPKTDFRPDETVLLYGEKLVDNTDPVVADKVTCAGFRMEESNGLTGPEEINGAGNIGNINVNARFDLYFPKKPNGQMVIVCPGGGYSIVSSYNEGVYVAEWLAERGITAAVVKYRLPAGHWEVPLADVQNTFRYCRENAEKWGISQIGVMGFSAGGHLAVTASVMYADAATRPDFSVFIYPVVTFDTTVSHGGTHDQLIGNEREFTSRSGKTWKEWDRAKRQYSMLEKRYSLENQVSPDNAPAFLALCSDDRTVPAENSIRLYRSLLSCNVPVEMHIYPSGGHGWGFSAERYVGKGHDGFSYARDEFYSSLERWLEAQRNR